LNLFYARSSKYTLFASLLVPAMLIAADAIDPDDVKAQNFSFVTRMNYNSAVANGIKTVNILVVTKMGRTEQAIQAFTALNGKAVERYDAVGYFWGNIPTEQVPKLLAVADIDEFQLDGERGSLIEYYEPTDPNTLKPGGLWTRVPASPPGSQTAKLPELTPLPELTAGQLEGDNPYLPWHRVGLPGFLRQHPTFDGRGATVAVVGYGIGDLLHPVMQEALTLDGKPVPKIAGILDVPRSENDLYAVRLVAEEPPALEPQYLELQMTQEIQWQTNSGSYQSVSFTLPAPGSYKIARLEHDGRAFWVLWSPSKSSVWVDTNGNNSFADETELKDINLQFTAGLFPAEQANLDKPLALPVSFAITIDESKSQIRFFVADNDVGNASTIAGKGFLGGNANGIAPGARILYVPLGLPYQLASYHQNLKAYILTAARPDVDVIEGGAYIVNPPFVGKTVTSLILDRLALVYQKPMFFIDGDMGGGPHVFGIRDYMSSEDWRQLYGVDAPLRDNTIESNVETMLDGTSKPDFLLPDSIYATSCNLPAQASRTFANYREAHCYGQVGSQSEPVAAAAGLAAVLISAAKQTGTQYSLDRIAWALRSGAKYLDQMAPNQVGFQGYGIPDIQESWKLLSSAEPTPSFAVSSVSNGRLEDYRRTPHQGTGVNEFFGVRPGSTGSRNVTVTRSSGPAEATRYLLSWRADDGTFTAPPEVELPLNKAVDIPIGYAPQSMGIHQALLQIVDPANNMVLESFLNTVAASLPLGGETTTITWSPDGKGIPLSHEVCPLFDVQPDVASLSFHMTLPSGTALTQIFSSPLLGPEWYLRRTVDAPESHTTTFDNEDDTRYALFAHPPAGPWAFCVENFLGPARPPKRTTIAYTQPEIKLDALTASVKLDAAQGKVDIKNQGGAMKKAALHVRLGYEERHSITIGPPGSTTEIDTAVVDGTQVLLFRIQVADKTAGLAATVYNCADFASNPEVFRPQGCRFQDFREEPQTIEYRLPHEGQWKLFLYRILGEEALDGDNTPVEVQIIQIPAGDNQAPLAKIPNQDDQVGEGLAARRALAKKAEPVKIEGTQAVGAVAAGASVTQAVHVDMTAKKAPGTPVVVTEMYDLSAEENAAEFAVKMYPFDPTHSRPIALGMDIEPFPEAAPTQQDKK
jgi:hypothetical protein